MEGKNISREKERGNGRRELNEDQRDQKYINKKKKLRQEEENDKKKNNG